MQDGHGLERMEDFREVLRKLRGKNLLRGGYVCLRAQREIRIPLELRGEVPGRGLCVVRFPEREGEVYARFFPDGETLYLREYEMNMENFGAAVLQRVRGKAYLHSSSEKAAYRSRGDEKK